VPPILAVEVAGDATSDTEAALRDKADWYLRAGVKVVWIVLPEARAVVMINASGSTRHGRDDVVPAIAELPGLAPKAAELFVQIDTKG
jgi:Uma2 family endonuclease